MKGGFMRHAVVFRSMLVLGLLGACAPAALAQAVRIVVPGPPGGFADIAVRLASDRLQQALGGPVVIEHKPGAGGTVGLEFLRNQKPDGATLAMINLSAAANESLVKGKSWNLLSDFEPVGQYAWLANVLIVHPSVGGDSLRAMVDGLKAKGGATSYASGGVGSPAHLVTELFRGRSGLALTHVPYKGAPPAVASVVAGETAFMFGTASSAIGQVRGGKVRALAVTTAERLAQLPDVPTLAEAGYGDMNVTDWAGLVAPRGTPPEARERIHRAFAGAFADPEASRRLREATILPVPKAAGGAEFGAFLKSEVEKWAKVIREAGITPN
jgi:tripartite-type tricarboxylate transporter receptor subunit TctC